jgi:serine/threonine protein kinase/Tfp pilus assembly protein PilF
MIGRTLSHYRILEQIGTGGMGEVYRARDERLERDVALKILPPGAVSDDGARKRFRREALALSRLNHPNIATVLDFDRQDDVDFLVMEYVAGEGVADKVRGGPLAEKEVARLGLELAEGIAAAHAQSVIHRDLKPGNLRLMPDGRLKILDFGLAQLLEAAGAERAGLTETASATGAGVAVGTLPYMAPERLRGERADARSDIWAVGLVLYELAMGRRAFPEGDNAQLITAILHEAPSRPSDAGRPISPGLESIIAKCLEKDPENRYQSAKELAVDLRRLGATSQAVGSWSAAHSRSRPWVAAGALGLAVTVAASLFALDVGGLRRRLLGGASAAQVRSLAVLPLEDLSEDPDKEYFADGMTEELISSLGEISGLRVISRTSVMTLKHAKKSLPEMARALNVDALIEGSVLRSGDRVRITASLIGTSPERQLWSDSYERDARDILSLQTDVAGAIAREIRLKVASGEQGRPIYQQAVSPAAYEAYLRGKFYSGRMGNRDFQEAIKQFNRAIELQPNFAQAWAGLAAAHYSTSTVYVPPRDAMPMAREAAKRALSLDRNLSEAHAVLGTVSAQFDWNWPVAEREFQTALRLNPSDANAHIYYSFMLTQTGRLDEGVSHARRAHDLDPLSSATEAYLANSYFFAGRYDSSLAISERLVASEPMHRGGLSASYSALGRHDRAIAEAKTMVSLAGDRIAWVTLTRAYALAGRRSEAFAALERSREVSKGEYLSPVTFAAFYAHFGYKDQAFEWLERAYKERDENIGYINVVPYFRDLRGDARFDDLLRRLRLKG